LRETTAFVRGARRDKWRQQTGPGVIERGCHYLRLVARSLAVSSPPWPRADAEQWHLSLGHGQATQLYYCHLRCLCRVSVIIFLFGSAPVNHVILRHDGHADEWTPLCCLCFSPMIKFSCQLLRVCLSLCGVSVVVAFRLLVSVARSLQLSSSLTMIFLLLLFPLFGYDKNTLMTNLKREGILYRANSAIPTHKDEHTT